MSVLELGYGYENRNGCEQGKGKGVRIPPHYQVIRANLPDNQWLSANTHAKNMSTRVVSVIFALLVVTPVARSQGAFEWYFDTTEFIVQSTDQILLTCTLTNHSDQYFIPVGGTARFSGPLQNFYLL